MEELKQKFEEAKSSGDISSGNMQFDADFISIFQLYVAASKWVKEDDNVIRAVIRGGGTGRLVIDYSYRLDVKGSKKMGPATTTLREKFKPFFEKELGGDYLHRWDMSNNAIVVK
jgi:hypothetical protein